MKIDILIIGAGITGAGCSILLQKAGYKTFLVEKTALNKFKAGESLSPECRSLLRYFSVEMTAAEVQEYYGIDSCWGSNSISKSDFIFNPYGNGITIEKNSFEKKLVKKAVESGCTSSFSSTVSQVTFSNKQWTVVVQNELGSKTIKAKFIIVATGRSSIPFLNTGHYTYYDKQVALTCISDQYQPFGPLDKYLKICSFENGWLYANFLPGKKYVMSLFTDSDLIIGGPKNYFLKTFSFPDSTSMNVRTVDARTRWTNIHSGEGWLRLGDAAYTIDPLSGQGIKKNIQMTVFCVEHIKSFLSKDLSIHAKYKRRNLDDFTAYLKKGSTVYQRESRYNDKPFWTRRIKII